MREIIFDTETTGISISGGDRVVELGCIELFNRVATGRTLHLYFNPERDMPAEAAAVHGLTNEFLSDKPVFAACVDEIMAFIGDDGAMVAHNASFDLRFMNNEFALVSAAPLDRTRIIDTLKMAKAKFPGQPAKLDDLCARYGVDTSARTKHGALLDSELLADVYVRLVAEPDAPPKPKPEKKKRARKTADQPKPAQP